MRYFVFFACFLLVACGVEGERPLSFTSVQPSRAVYMVWTGNLMLQDDATKKQGFSIDNLGKERSEWLTTVQVKQNGNGYLCYSNNERNDILRVKYKDGILYVQDGSSFLIKETNDKDIYHFAENTLMGRYYYMHKDTRFREASRWCDVNWPRK